MDERTSAVISQSNIVFHASKSQLLVLRFDYFSFYAKDKMRFPVTPYNLFVCRIV